MPFELKWIHILGPVLATLAMFFVGNNMVRQDRGKDLRIFPTLVLFVVAVLFHFVIGEGSFLDRMSILLLDFGIGMIIDASYLKAKNVHPKVFYGLGMLSLFGGAVMIFFLHYFGLMINKAGDWLSNDDQQTKKELLVELGNDDRIEEISAVLKKFGADYEIAFPDVSMEENSDLAQTWLIRVEENNAGELEKILDLDDENVDEAEENFPVALVFPITSEEKISRPGKFFANDPGLEKQWWMPQESANEIHGLLSKNKPLKKARVAIVDTGVDAAHEDVKDGFEESPGKTDGHGHGTHCACLAGAITNNKKGIASLNWEGKYIAVKSFPALNAKGQGTVYSVAKAIIKAAESGADVISMSLGGRALRAPKTTVNAVKYALSRNTIVIAAAGNSAEDARYHSPANVEGVITVAAVNENGSRAVFSNINTKLKMPLAAPGVNIYSCKPGQKYVSWNGTSMATPIVAGLAGIIRAMRPGLSPNEVYKILIENGTDGPSVNETGKIIDAGKTLKMLMKGS